VEFLRRKPPILAGAGLQPLVAEQLTEEVEKVDVAVPLLRGNGIESGSRSPPLHL